MAFEEIEKHIANRADCRRGIGASEVDIDLAESNLGVSFGPGLRRFLRRFGWLEVGPDEYYGLGSDVPNHMSLLLITASERTVMNPRLRHSLVPVMNDGGGNLYCVDTAREQQVAPVVFWDHDLGADQDPEFVAASFEDWLLERLRLE